MKKDIYKNLHKNTWSIRDCKSRLVVDYSNFIFIKNAHFVVSQAGRNRVVKEKKKNVHAFARGSIVSKNICDISQLVKNGFREAYYNPYLTSFFIDKTSGEELRSTYYMYFDSIRNIVIYKEQQV